MAQLQFSPGSLIKARGREWMVIGSIDHESVTVRPLNGSEEDQTVIYLPLEQEQVVAASFQPPLASQVGNQETALLLRDALMLSLRRGAGPFRSFGQIAVEPRAYQLVPLMMALKQEVVRLLIADDVGIGKTIEGCLIARELLDRGEIDRVAVLCPPHLVDQWISEMETLFHLKAVAVTANSAGRLEKNLPIGQSIFSVHPITVVSLDYIKSQNRRNEFLRACPEFVIVDEAHTCSASGQGRHQRYELLHGLSENKERHLVLLTATPHSGDDDAFYRLLGLLDPEFEKLKDTNEAERKRIREKLANHFVQRRRPDIDEWEDNTIFPKRETSELTYKLTGQWLTFLEHVIDYCAEVVEAAGQDERKRRLNFWGTLALLRCVSSSPHAAVRSLMTRANNDQSEELNEALRDELYDGDADHLNLTDVEPITPLEGSKIQELIKEAKQLAGQKGDPKLKRLKDHLEKLISDGFNPVVFCRFIATAEYIKEQLSDSFKGTEVAVITGNLNSKEREEKVEEMGKFDSRLLIATDCLSEGINLQNYFDAVVHYDLSWNPTRHEQREGRVDRYRQPSPIVRATLMYGENNPVDGAILDVIIRKADSIRRELGVPVPLPDDGRKLMDVLLKKVVLGSKRDNRQMAFDFNKQEEFVELDLEWKKSAEKARKNHTVFAQKSLKPAEVLPELQKVLNLIGSQKDVERFTTRALKRLGAGPEIIKFGYKLPLASLNTYIKERLALEGISGNVQANFGGVAKKKYLTITRSHPLVHVLAESLLEKTVDFFSMENENNDPAILGRVGCWVSDQVTAKTTIVVLRIRHQFSSTVRNISTTSVVEEASCVAWTGKEPNNFMEGQEVLELLANDPKHLIAKNVIERNISEALAQIKDLQGKFDQHASDRAQNLTEDHRNVRKASAAKGLFNIKPLLPCDIMAVYVLLPVVD
jgi:superfamily II DNA or RNA helicase